MRKRFLKHGIAVIGIAVLAFLSISSFESAPSAREQAQQEEEARASRERQAQEEERLAQRERERQAQEAALREHNAQARAQPREVSIGTAVSGRLGEGEEHWLRFQAAESGRVAFTNANSFLGVITIESYDANNILIAQSASISNPSMSILEISVEAGSVYLLRLTRNRLVDNYSITAVVLPALENFIFAPENFRAAIHTSTDLFGAASFARTLSGESHSGRWYVSDLTFIRQSGTRITFSSDDNVITQIMTIDRNAALQAGQRVRVYYRVWRRSFLDLWDIIAIERRESE